MHILTRAMIFEKCIQALSQSYRRGFACEDRAKAVSTRRLSTSPKLVGAAPVLRSSSSVGGSITPSVISESSRITFADTRLFSLNRLQVIALYLLVVSMLPAEVLYQDSFDGDTLAVNSNGIGGGAINGTIEGHAWTDDGAATLVTNDSEPEKRALLYSANTFQSDHGFRLTVNYTTGSLGDSGAHNLAFGLIASDTDPSTYSGFNPFKIETGVYSIGVNLTANGGAEAQGLNFTDGATRTTLDQSGSRAQFKSGEACEVSIEIAEGGYWCYRIDGVYESSGVLLEGFDLSQNYHVVVYGQDDDGGGKSIQSIQLETAPAPGERATKLRGSWHGGEGDLESIKDFKTLDEVGVRFSDGASLSAQHYVPHKLLETVALEGVDGAGPSIDYIVAPTWGNLALDEPENDAFLDEILEIRAAGFRVHAYTNSENFVGSNGDSLQEFVDRWMEYCDADPDMQAFINSQPFHTGVWNQTTQQYDDASATYPNRKYMFCYAEFVLKDYSLRYGNYIDAWIFDDGGTMEQNGDNATSGIIEEQRIYQAFANAVRAGNPDCPIAFNNGRSTLNYNSFPFAHAVRFDDFTFGHAFGGNNDHASKTGTQFANNYKHITRMTATNGYVHDGGAWEWDDLIVGNMHSKLSTTAWKYGTNQAWEEADFLQWNLEAMQAGGHLTWSGSIWRSNPTLQSWAYDLLKALDDHLAEFENPGAPNWARAYTPLPDAYIGVPYSRAIVEGVDFWDPEGDAILDVLFAESADGVPSWLTVQEVPVDSGTWVLSGTPTETSATEYDFRLRATDASGGRDRWVNLVVNAIPFMDMESRSISGGASWVQVGPELIYDSGGTNYQNRAICYSSDAYQSDSGLRLTVNYTTGNIGDSAAHNFSFGLIRTDTDLSTYAGFNPFKADTSVYSIGVNLTEDSDATAQGLNFTNGATRSTLDQSGDNIQFPVDHSTTVVIEIRNNGAWSYSVSGVTEASGIIPEGFDLSQQYRVAVYGQDDNGDGKSIQSIELESISNSPPVAGNVATTVDANSSVGVTLVGSDAEGDSLTYSILIAPENGILSGIAPNLTYTPNPDYVGLESFTYKAHDGAADSEDATVRIAVGEPFGLVADWSLDDVSSGEAFDVSGHNFHGTLLNGTGVSGVHADAVYFNGMNSTVSIPTEAFGSISDEITISLWANGDVAQELGNSFIFATDNSGDRVLNIHLPWTNSKVYWDAGTSGGTDYDRISTPAVASEFMGRWNHWTFTKSTISGEMKIYLNGALWHSGIEKIKPISGITEVTLGSSQSGAHYHGMLDEIRLYNTELTASEVSDLYDAYEGYEAWTSRHPSLVDLEPDADADQDGITSLLEYTLNGSPLEADQVILPTLDASGEYFVFTFTRRVESASDTAQVFQYSSNLLNWYDLNITGDRAAEVSVVDGITGTEDVTVTVSKDMAEDGRLFGRLQVEAK
ncbi:LamG-like jellyroll fold domain-containing protein [Lentimonas sp. CC4]|uniref:LamG-like jellyroll fold domain-containing protein n=1 Tax=Lentimonas sp. CC4 TaxID=2676099 RepID=UPI001389C40D|nr:LamG-like jellyroll fold domain-containing protein [Lentimonas sp. CC4]